MIRQEMLDVMPHTDVIDKMPSPRVIKSHLPFYLLPPQLLETCKVIFSNSTTSYFIIGYATLFFIYYYVSSTGYLCGT